VLVLVLVIVIVMAAVIRTAVVMIRDMMMMMMIVTVFEKGTQKEMFCVVVFIHYDRDLCQITDGGLL